MNKSLKHRILVMVVLGLVAAVISAGVVYASLVQWTKEVPATVERAPVGELPADAVLLFADEGLNEPLEKLEFTIPKWLPPLDEVIMRRDDSIPVWIQNNSDHTLMVVETHHALHDAIGNYVGHVHLRLEWWAHKDPRIIEPGEVVSGWVHLSLGHHAPDTFDFGVVFSAVGGVEPGELLHMMPMVEPPPEE